jgi:hypothetical protein
MSSDEPVPAANKKRSDVTSPPGEVGTANSTPLAVAVLHEPRRQVLLTAAKIKILALMFSQVI